MKNYIKLTVREKQDHVILHIGTNEFNSNRQPELISKLIVNLASTPRSDCIEVNTPNIIFCNDNNNENGHCVKSFHIWSYSGPYFPVFGLNTDQINSKYGHFLCSGYCSN